MTLQSYKNGKILGQTLIFGIRNEVTMIRKACPQSLPSITIKASSVSALMWHHTLTSWFSISRNTHWKPCPKIMNVCLWHKTERQIKREMVVMNQGSVSDYMRQHAALSPRQPCREEPACSPKPPSVCGPARSIRYPPHLHSAPCCSAWSTPTPTLLVRAIFTNSCRGTG